MSVFSLIRRGRAQAKEHNAKKAEKAKDETVKLPYKHVVTHAAIDALSGAPSTWKHADRPRIMEQNKRRTAMAASETNLAGMPRVGSSLSYVSYASVYATPVVPLPKNYSYNNIPTSWRDQMSNQEGSDYFSHPGSVRTAKGKEREHIQPSTSIGPTPMLSPGQASTASSQGVFLGGNSGNSSSSDEDLEIRTKAVNRNSQNVRYQSSTSQRSHTSSKNSHQASLTGSSHTNIEAAAKPDRHYPPPAQSTYFSAPRPVNRRTSGAAAGSSIPPISAITERVSSAASSSSASDRFSSASSIASIGVAIAPPLPPCTITPTPAQLPEGNAPSEQNHSSLTPTSTPPTQALQRFSTEQRTVSTDNGVSMPNGPATPPTPATQRRRRRLSKSRPSSIADSGAKMSVDTVRPARPSTSGTPFTPNDLGPVDPPAPQTVDDTTAVRSTESGQRTPKRLSKNPESKSSQKGRWIFRLGGKTPAVAAH
ncbi:hypothetical protein GGR54DRAFT_146519 [Hypoxylon sp. NC1633]|nr:hypothetical protein GGR54DRAFT_146519 [Hypoxylon sp. NC1633]